MVSVLRNFFRRPAIRSGSRRDLRGRHTDPRFASFIAESNRKTLNTGFRDAVLRGRMAVRYAVMTAAGCAAAWVLIESAHALSMF